MNYPQQIKETSLTLIEAGRQLTELKRDAAQADKHRGRLLTRLERLRGEFNLCLVKRQTEIATTSMSLAM